jgi:GntR family transcriptional regulator, N-acetylglucosamine utilization regulator
MSAIYRNSPLPRYYQLKEILRESVCSGEWQPGDLIASERELSETYGISRMTARQAITDLVNEGLLYREQGKGTFVSERKIRQQLCSLSGFTEDILARGQRPDTRVLSAGMCPADGATAEKLRIDAGTPIFRLQRLRLADGEPLASEVSHIRFEGCEQLVAEDLAHHSLYRVLETHYGIPLVEADQEVEAGLAGDELGPLLNISAASPVLCTRRVSYAERNQPIEYARAVYCGHKYTLYTHLEHLARPNHRKESRGHRDGVERGGR